ncbi:MAG: NYN domain-containing protein [Candidatus Omnitrophota bacterium]|jgi:predicted RNA-binding protein with PIN domain
MILVVDGYNAINAIPEAAKELKKSLKAARTAILALSKEYARSSGYIKDFCVVFDGVDKHRRRDRFTIPKGGRQVFSGTGDGDEKVIETVRKYSGKGKVVLASNDNYVRNNARAYGAAIIDVRELAGKKREKIKSRSGTKRIEKSLKKEITREYREELGL